MIIAVTYEEGNVFQHFGHSKYFKIYLVENNKVIKEEVLPTNGEGHGALGLFLKKHNVDTLICGGIGGGAQSILKTNGIKIYGGVIGNADEAVKALLNNTLKYNPKVMCNHDHHTHSCGEHSCNVQLKRSL